MDQSMLNMTFFVLLGDVCVFVFVDCRSFVGMMQLFFPILTLPFSFSLCRHIVILCLVIHFHSPAQRCYELMLQRCTERTTFGKHLWQHGMVQQQIASSFADLNAARLLTLQCAHEMDLYGPKLARQYISSIKVTVPHLCSRIIDRAVQVHGGAGVCEDYILANALSSMRTLRIADGPDEVHCQSVALLEMKKVYKNLYGIDPPRQSRL